MALVIRIILCCIILAFSMVEMAPVTNSNTENNRNDIPVEIVDETGFASGMNDIKIDDHEYLAKEKGTLKFFFCQIKRKTFLLIFPAILLVKRATGC